MDPLESPESLPEKDQIYQLEQKLVKFKKFVVSLRNERTQLQEQIASKDSEIEKLKSDLGKFQSKSYQQIFQNFHSLQAEYDKVQDDVELYKKTNKSLENDLIKCTLELNQCRETCATQKEEIDQLQSNSAQQQSQIDSILESNKALEGKIIVLQTENKNEKKKSSNFQVCESERNEIKNELAQKNDQIVQLSEELKKSTTRIKELEEELEEKNVHLNQYEALKQTSDQQSTQIEKLENTLQIQNEKIDQCNQLIEELNSKNDQLEKKNADLQLEHSQKVSNFELTISELKNKVKLNEEDLEISRSKFEEYKLRVSNVLKENNNFNNFEYSKNIENLQLKIESLEEENRSLKLECNKLTSEAERIRSLNNDITSKWQWSQGELKDYDDLKTRFNALHSEKSKLLTSIDLLKGSFSKEKQSIIEENQETLESIRIKYENRIKELEDEMINFRNTSDDSNSVVNSNTSFEEIKEENLSYQSNNSNSERNFLEEILNLDSNSKSSDATHSSNIDNLTQLLSESENSITLLSEQNRLLKEEIRRMQRSVDRMDIANNLEYLKNVLMKFLTIKGLDERERLITVLTTILKLTPEERDVFHQCVQDNPQGNSKWLWQWSS